MSLFPEEKTEFEYRLEYWIETKMQEIDFDEINRKRRIETILMSSQLMWLINTDINLTKENVDSEVMVNGRSYTAQEGNKLAKIFTDKKMFIELKISAFAINALIIKKIRVKKLYLTALTIAEFFAIKTWLEQDQNSDKEINAILFIKSF